MDSHEKIFVLLIIGFIALCCVSFASASMTIEKGSFSTGENIDEKTFAEIFVGKNYTNETVFIKISYSRDGRALNNDTPVKKTVNTNGYIKDESAEAYEYFPDHAKIDLYDDNKTLIDSQDVFLKPTSGKQPFEVNKTSNMTSSTNSSSDDGDGSNTTTNADSKTYESTNTEWQSGNYIGNAQNKIYHTSGCSDVNNIDSKYRVAFSNKLEAEQHGYIPCEHCNP